MDVELYRPGSAFEADGRARTTRREIYLGFIDLAPGNWWPHDSLYVLCDPLRRTASARRIRSPPRLAEGRRFRVIERGDDVPPRGAKPFCVFDPTGCWPVFRAVPAVSCPDKTGHLNC